MPDLSGQDIGRYHVVETLGEGGMATVYKAYDTRLEREVAVKVIRRDAFAPQVLGEMLRRFEREAKSLARMSHPNIVKIFDYGEFEGSPYLVMEYLPGGTLKDFTGQALPYPEAAAVLAPIARALEYAHEMDVLHRDVKPANILLTHKGQPMLSDFGIAKIVEEGGVKTLTGTGVGIGTPEYMAPEQWLGSATTQSDIYSLGVVFYEMVTGRKPYLADTPLAIMLKHINDPLPRPRQFIPYLPEELEGVIFKAMAKQARERYATMSEFARALEKLAPHAAFPTSAAPMRDKGKIDGEFGQTAPDLKDGPKVGPAVAGGQAAPIRTTWGETNKETLAQEDGSRLLSAPAGQTPTKAVPAGKKRWPVWILALGGLALVLVCGLSLAGILAGMKGTGPLAFLAGAMQTPGVVSETSTTSPQKASITPARTLEQTSTPASTHTKAFTPTPAAGDAQISPVDGMVMVFVPAGEFLMGSTADEIDRVMQSCGECDRTWLANELPQHTIYLDAYWIDRTEVTNAMYAQCVQAGSCNPPHEMSSYTHSSYYGDAQYDNYPVLKVDWTMAEAYCQWAGRRLPSEAEWEKAARGTDGRIYTWGSQAQSSTLLNYHWNAGDTTAVGNYPAGASPYGALDMLGNVFEWVNDWYDGYYYFRSPAENPGGPAAGEFRVIRGGGWQGADHDSRTASRSLFLPNSWNYTIGFRCAQSAGTP